MSREAPSHKKSKDAQTHPLQQGLTFVAVLVALSIVAWIGWSAYTGNSVLSSFGISPASQSSKSTKTVRIGLTNAPSSLDISTVDETAIEQVLISNVYETLVGRSSNNKTDNTGIASSWKVSSDGLTYTFTIPSGITFSNGDALTASDVTWSLEQVLKKSYVDSSNLTHLKSVSNSNANTVKITLSSPEPDLLWQLSGRAGIVYDQEASYDKAREAIGSGPYTVKSFNKGSSLVLQARDSYWKQKKSEQAKTQEIDVTYYSDSASVVKALAAGKIDIAFPVDGNQVSTAQAISAVTTKATASTHRVALAFNNSDSSNFSDKRYRQGFRYLINQSSLISQLGISASVIAGPISSLDPGYVDLTSQYPYDQATGKSLLAYFGNYGNYKRTLIYSENMGSVGARIATILQQQFTDAGRNVTVTALSDSDYQNQVIDNKEFDMTLVEFDGSHDLGSIVDPDYFINYTSSETEELWAAAEASTSYSDYVSHLKKTAAQVADDAPLAWLYEEEPIIAYSRSVSGLPTSMVQERLDLRAVIKN